MSPIAGLPGDGRRRYPGGMRPLPGREKRSTLDEPAAAGREAAGRSQRERILRATGELVAKRGYHDVRVTLIVKRAHVSYRTFYKHFPGKEECFLALFDAEMARSRGRIEAALTAESGEPWPVQVIAALRALFDSILLDPLIARATIIEAPTVGAVMTDRYERLTTALSPLLAQGRECSPAAAALPPRMEDTLGGGVLWSAYQRLMVDEVDGIEALLPEAIEFVLRPYLGEAEALRWARTSTEDAAVVSG
jgi:AcrR family transcriptional regulator